MTDYNEIYYRIQLPNNDDFFSVCTVQWFDEFDYDQNLWVKDAQGEPLKFATKEDAKDFMNTYMNPMFIRDEDWSADPLFTPHDDQSMYFG